MENLYKTLKSKPFLMAGPCVIESEDICFKIAEECLKICEKSGFFYIFKASFDKANRTSASSFRGVGMEDGIKFFEKIKTKFGVPIVTDIHESWQAEPVGEVCDILQIPAFLCRQTDLLIAAAKTGRVINVKKAQFLSGAEMKYPVEKVTGAGNDKVMLTERGSMFGYNNLVVDFRNIIDMGKFGFPVIMDMTHSAQRPGGLGGCSGGNPEYAVHFGKAAAAMGVKGFFAEVHPEPSKALSDGANMLQLGGFEKVMEKIKRHLDND